jgi:hypothetical protein
MRYSVLFFTISIFSVFSVVHSQSTSFKDFRFFEITGHSGSHIYTGEELKEALANGYGAIQVKYGWQSNNPENWQSMYLYPAYGFGWYSGFIGNPDILGSPGAIYGFISFPLFNHPRHQLLIDPAFGISYDFNPYDIENNVLNDAIGSRFNVFFNLKLGAKYRMNREIDLIYGLDFTHFSNGRMYRPNAGLNMFGPNLGIRYNFNNRQNRVDNSSHPDIILASRPVLHHFQPAVPIRKGEILVYGAGGLVQNREDMGTDRQHAVFTSFIEYNYILNAKSGFAAGFDFFYDNSMADLFSADRLDIYGMHIGYDFRFWQLSLKMQVGTYLHERGHQMKGNFFFRPAIKYDFHDHLFLQLGLKTQAGMRADWIEYGLGIRI